MKKFLKFIIPFLFLIAGAGLLVSWAFYIEPNVNKATVIVAKKDIDFKQKITPNDLLITEIPKDALVAGAYNAQDIKLIVGKNASIKINKGTQFYPNLVDTYDLIPNKKKGEFIAPIPTKWLFAVPGSLRKTYFADVYAIPDESQSVIDALLKKTENTKENSDETDSQINTNEISDQFITQNNEAILKNVKISSVKDSANKEVKEPTDGEGSTTPGVISSIEIVANNKMLNKMQEYTEKGYKLYIVYKYER